MDSRQTEEILFSTKGSFPKDMELPWLSQNHKIKKEKLIWPFSGDNKRKKYLYNNPEFEDKFIPRPHGCKPETNIT